MDAQDLNEEADKRNVEVNENAEEIPKTKTEEISQYQQKLKDERARRFGVGGRIPEP